MASILGPNNPTLSFPGPLGSKRRRMRSGGNVSTLSNNQHVGAPIELQAADEEADVAGAVDLLDEDSVPETKSGQGGKCKGASTIPIFLKKTYKMIDTCDSSIASWTEDGDMFVIKDPETFAGQVIPQYFDHNKFSSFARQLNFYGFRKMQSKPIKNSDFDAQTAKYVTFFNENFKRGRCDLLKNIQRSTRGGGTATPQDQQREVQSLRDQVAALEQRIDEMNAEVEERMRRLELDMLARMEQMMLAMQQQQQQQQQQPVQLQLQSGASVGTIPHNRLQSLASLHSVASFAPQQHWDSSLFAAASRTNSVAASGTFQQPEARPPSSAPTLPPHPKQKQLPVNGILPPTFPGGPDRLNSLRGISTLTRGLSGLSRGASVESNSSAALMRNTWEDKFFSMLMLGEAEQNAAAFANGALLGPTPIAPGATPSNGPVTISSGSMGQQFGHSEANEDLSDVSEGGLH